MNNSQILNQIESEYGYLHRLVEIQWDLRVYNGLYVLINNRIDAINKIIIEEEEKHNETLITHSEILLEKYLKLKKLYLENHPWKGLDIF